MKLSVINKCHMQNFFIGAMANLSTSINFAEIY